MAPLIGGLRAGQRIEGDLLQAVADPCVAEHGEVEFQ